MIRATTNAVLKGYRANLNKSTLKFNSARNTVLSGRVFNSYAEDPATASQAFQMRRSFLRTNSQITQNQAAVYKYESGYKALESVVGDVNNLKKSSSLSDVMEGLNDPTGGGRKALGKSMTQLADKIVETMNSKYGDTFVFAGADGLNVPFTWQENDDGSRTLLYRGLPVNAAAGSDAYKQLEYMSAEEHKFVDIGLGIQEAGGGLVESSAFDVALQGVNFLGGFGADEEGLPNNVVAIIDRAGEILNHCDENGYFEKEGDRDELEKLLNKLNVVGTTVSEKHVELSAEAEFLKDNLDRLEDTSDNLNEQFLGLEQCDLADAITSFAWAQYCYNAALKVGNSILSESLMDYIGG